MKAIIKKIGIGTEYMGEISDCWLIVQLKNGLNIKLLEPDCNILNTKEDEKIECLILCIYPQDINKVNFKNGHNLEKPILLGRYIEDYRISQSWWVYNPSFKTKIYPAVETVNGILLLHFNTIPQFLKNGDIISFTVGRLDLLAWYPIEE